MEPSEPKQWGIELIGGAVCYIEARLKWSGLVMTGGPLSYFDEGAAAQPIEKPHLLGLSNGLLCIVVKERQFRPIDRPQFVVGDTVRVRADHSRVGTVRAAWWHFRDKAFKYCLRLGDRDSGRTYLESDLEPFTDCYLRDP